MVLVISDSLVLAGAIYADPTTPIIGWHNQVVASGVDADLEEADHPAINLANPATNLYWRSTGDDQQYVTFAVDEEEPVDYIGIAGHNFGSSGTVISIEYQQFDSLDWTELVEGFVVADDAPLIIRFRETLVSNLRLNLIPDTAAPRASVVHIGKLLVMLRGIPAGHTPLEMGRNTKLAIGVAESGDFLGKIVLGKTLNTAVAFEYLDGDWYRRVMEPFVAQGIGTTFFFAGFPRTRPRAVGYAWLVSDPRPAISQVTGEIDVTLEINGVVS